MIIDKINLQVTPDAVIAMIREQIALASDQEYTLGYTHAPHPDLAELIQSYNAGLPPTESGDDTAE